MREFVNEVSRVLNYDYRELIEVDLIIFKILSFLSKNSFFKDNFLLKGGTCLIKHYLDYYRFSEDIDLTLANQGLFEHKSKSKRRSSLINKAGEIIENMCKQINLDFINNKSSERYFHFSGNNMVNLKLYYHSEILNIERAIKLEINLDECLKFQSQIGSLRSIIIDDDELRFLFPEEFEEYSEVIPFPVYDIKEILCEKVRAILTRKNIKGRDFIDIFLILNNYSLNLKNLMVQIIEKTIFTLSSERFKDNLKDKLEFINSGDLFTWGEEQRLLLKEINKKEFGTFLDQFNTVLKEITEKIFEEISNS